VTTHGMRTLVRLLQVVVLATAVGVIALQFVALDAMSGRRAGS
jgi:hypothetical protein